MFCYYNKIMGSGSSHNVKVHSYVSEIRTNDPTIIYDQNGKFISKRRMQRMAYKNIYGRYNTIQPINVSKAEDHFRKIDRNKILSMY